MHEGLAGYVTVRGGGYFFVPGMTTLRYLAGGPTPAPRPEEVKPVPRPPSKADAVRVVALMRFSLLIAALLAIFPLSLLSRAHRSSRWWRRCSSLAGHGSWRWSP